VPKPADRGPRIGHVHLADTNREAPGHGTLGRSQRTEALDSIAYEGFLSFEVFPLPDPQQAIRDSVQRFAQHWMSGRIEGLPAPGRPATLAPAVGLLHGLEKIFCLKPLL